MVFAKVVIKTVAQGNRVVRERRNRFLAALLLIVITPPENRLHAGDSLLDRKDLDQYQLMDSSRSSGVYVFSQFFIDSSVGELYQVSMT